MWANKESPLIPISREIVVSTVAEQKDKIRTHNFLFLPSTDSEEILDKINTLDEDNLKNSNFWQNVDGICLINLDQRKIASLVH